MFIAHNDSVIYNAFKVADRIYDDRMVGLYAKTLPWIQ